MLRPLSVLTSFLLVLILPDVVIATIITVDDSGAGDFLTIQGGLDSAIVGDTVRVLPGTYAGTGNQNLDFANKNIVLVSQSGAGATTISGDASSQAFLFDGAETNDAIVDGFTITGFGGGSPIEITLGSAPTIRNCVITRNYVGSSEGGGIYISASSPLFEGLVVADNYDTLNGGGIAIAGGSPTFDSCMVIGNFTDGVGGGVRVQTAGTPTFTRCTIAGNRAGADGSAKRGGGLHVADLSAVTLNQSIVWGNRADQNNEIYMPFPLAVVNLNCCDIDSSEAGGAGTLNYVDCIYVDPHFCTPAYCYSEPYANGDYSIGKNSPCLATATPCGQQIGTLGENGCGNIVAWTGGGAADDWYDPGNWTTGVVPQPSDHVQITRGVGDYVLLDSSATIDAMTICGAGDIIDTLEMNGSSPFAGKALPSGVSDTLTIGNSTDDGEADDSDNTQNSGKIISVTFAMKVDSTEIWLNRLQWVIHNFGIIGEGELRNEGEITTLGTEPQTITKSLGLLVDTLSTKISIDTFTNLPAGTLHVESGTLEIASRAFVNLGTIIVDTLGTLELPAAPVSRGGKGIAETVPAFLNGSTGVIDLIGHLEGGGSLNNLGSIRKSGPDTSLVSVILANEQEGNVSGLIELQSGTMRISSQFTNDGELELSAGNVLILDNTLVNRDSGAVDLAGTISGIGSIHNRGRLSRVGPGITVMDLTVTNFPRDTLGARGSIVANIGTVRIDKLVNGGHVRTGQNGTVEITGTFANNEHGTVAGAGTIVNPTFSNGGAIVPGISSTVTAELDITGEYTGQPSSDIFINLGGTVAGSGHDYLDISGPASWSGGLHVNFINSFDALPGDTFQVAEAAIGPITNFTCFSGLQPGGDTYLQPLPLPDGFLLVAKQGPSPNAPTVAVVDTFTTDWATPIEFAPQSNDLDNDGQPLSIVAINTHAVTGVAVLNPGDTSITYFAPESFVGTTSLSYSVTDCNGSLDSATVVIHVTVPTAISGDTPPAVADRIYPNFPNPFNPLTRIRYDLSRTGKVTLVVYDVRGREVRRLVDGRRNEGIHIVDWWGKNDSGTPVPSGLYLYRFEANGLVETRKMVLVR